VNGAEAHTGIQFPAIEALMPHRGPILLLDRVTRHDSEYTEAHVCVEFQSWLGRGDGSVAGWLAMEYMAQCVAAHESLLALDAGRPLPTGFLVSATRLCLHASHFAAGSQLRVRARRVRGRPGLGVLSHECSLHLADPTVGKQALLAEGRLSVAGAGSAVLLPPRSSAFRESGIAK